ncbi:MAG: calcium/sodium antiporter [Pseudomonadales bacterium]|nr:calcium/sodium antiporter [Pseudomonadales bacterium]
MLIPGIALLAGFLILFKSADYFVISAISTAKNFRISPMIIGLTIVALGTSAPEIFVSMTASLNGESDLAVGNAIGSNIANIGMVLGITAILTPLPFRQETLRQDLPILAAITICAGITLIDLELNLIDGIILLVCLIAFLARLAHEHMAHPELELIEEVTDVEEIPEWKLPVAAGVLVLSLVCLLLSSKLLVWSVVQIATSLGISEMIIGLTIIAVGTSLPELVVSVTSALKGHTDLAIGNIIGSNIFNILAVLSIPGIVSPTTLSPETLWRDFGLMFGLTALLMVFAYTFRQSARLTRIEGAVMLFAWCGYLVTLYFSAVEA